MTKLERQGLAVASVLLRGYPKGNERIDYVAVRTLLCQAYVCGAKGNLKQGAKPEAKKIRDDIETVLNALNHETERHFRASPATVALIKARLAEPDVTVAGIVKMIRRQCEKWIGTDMQEYLRPSTLFRASKFENYYTARDLPVHIPQKKKRRFGDIAYDE